MDVIDIGLQQSQQVKGNSPLWLNDAHTAWQVQSGTLAVFAVPVRNGVPEGGRRYLFSVSAGEALFGTTPTEAIEQLGFVAIALEPTELLPLPIDRLNAALPPREERPTGAYNPPEAPYPLSLLDTWIHKLGQVDGLPRPKTATFTPQTHFVAPLKGQICETSGKRVLWVRVQQGQTFWMGYPEFALDANMACFPIGQGMCLVADDNLEFYVRTTADVEHPKVLWNGLAELHQFFLRWLEWTEQQEVEAGLRRFQERQQLNQQVTQETICDLASVLRPQQDGYLFADNPLLIAAGAVGKALGVTIEPPHTSEDTKRVKEPLEAIARASRLRLRKVLLRNQWWRKDAGPLVAYTREDRRPVALLPISGDRYQLFDPIQAGLVGNPALNPSPTNGKSASGQSAPGRTIIDAKVASTLDPVAFMFYRPLPDGELKARDLLKFALKGRSGDLLAILLTGVAATLVGMIVPLVTAVLIDDAIPYSNASLIVQMGLGLLAAAFGGALFQLAQGIVSMRLETISDISMQAAVWDRLLKLRTTFFRQYSIGDLNSRVSAIGAIRRKLSGTVLQSIFSSFFALLNLGLLIYYSPQMAGLAVVVALVIMTFTAVSGALLIRKQRPLMELEGDIFGTMVQLINGVPKLRIAAVEERAFAHWGKKYTQQLRLLLSTQQLEDAVSVFNTVTPVLTTIALFWLASTLISPENIINGTGLSAGTFLAFSVAFGTFILGATSLSNAAIQALDVVPLWQRAQPILEAIPEVNQDKADPGRLTGEIYVDHVMFRYREDGPLILDDVCIQAAPGEFIALVGPSGSGKSTVMRMLLGFETPISGTIYYDGQDLSGLDVSSVRRQLGVVLQNGRINAGTIFENISSGAVISLEDAWKAAEMAGFADDVRAMPMQLHTLVSEGGSNLSGGQRQRLVIARALALKPRILFLDEATSALDNRTQAIVTESMDRLNVTRIVVAHRLSTIRNADRIYVLESGRVVQQGSFEELANQEGLFARLMARQMA
ncbi:MAG: NHLP bacteriocin export ABC transporter permease/ATPase subunit [Elainellaceae cyanobacterium]